MSLTAIAAKGVVRTGVARMSFDVYDHFSTIATVHYSASQGAALKCQGQVKPISPLCLNTHFKLCTVYSSASKVEIS
jgi:hypothetical protein